MGVQGVGEYGRVSAHPEPTPWRFFGSFLPGQKGTRPAGRNSPAACTAPAGAFRSATARRAALSAEMAAETLAKTTKSGSPRSSRPTRMQEKDYFFPCPSRAAKLWLIRSSELWISWSMDWYRTG